MQPLKWHIGPWGVSFLSLSHLVPSHAGHGNNALPGADPRPAQSGQVCVQAFPEPERRAP